jgi:alkyl hydroperoxide reductase subunit AhpC
MALAINDIAPDFEAQTTEGKIKFHDWIGDKWAVLFSHPKDFTPVCTTELGYMAKIKPEFDKRGVKIIGLSVDPVEKHAGWAADIKDARVCAKLSDDRRCRLQRVEALRHAAGGRFGDPAKRTAADNQTVRNVFVIGPDKKIKLILVYPMTTGRNFDEVLRVIDSLQLTAKHKVATPVNWKHGEDVIIAGSVSDDDAKKTYPQGWKAPKPYIRIVPQPKA